MTRDRDGNEDYVTTVLGLAGLAPGIAGAPPVSGIRRDPRVDRRILDGAVEDRCASFEVKAVSARGSRFAPVRRRGD